MRLKIFLLNLISFTFANECPSTECWRYNRETETCVIKAKGTGCSYSLKCDATSISFDFDSDKLFGTTDLEKFGKTDKDCITSANGVHTWSSNFANCGVGIKKDGEFIVFEKSLVVGAGIDLEGTEIYTNTGGTISLKIDCKYSASATATSAEVDVDAGAQMEATVVPDEEGSFDSGFKLKYYDNTWTDEATGSRKIGATVYPKLTWDVTSLAGKMGFYLKTCRVEDVSAGVGTGIKIIKESCFARVVGALVSGQKFDTSAIKFSYNSFSYDTSSADRQKLICEVELCVINQDTTKPDCNVPFHTDTADCPTDSGYEYTTTGLST